MGDAEIDIYEHEKELSEQEMKLYEQEMKLSEQEMEFRTLNLYICAWNQLQLDSLEWFYTFF